MATYYVSPNGSNTAPYDTWAKAALLPQTVVSHGNSVTGPHTVYIAPGEYNSYLSLSDADWAGCTWNAVAAHGAIILAPWAQIVQRQAARIVSSTTASELLRVYVANVSMFGLAAFGGGGTQHLLGIEAANFIGHNLYVGDAVNRTVSLYNAANARISNSRISGSKSSNHIYIGNASALTLINSVSDMSGQSDVGVHNISLIGTGQLVAHNCVLVGQRGNAVNNSGTGTAVINNSVLVAGSNTTSAAPTSGTVTLNNCATIQNWSSKTGGNIDAPRFVRHQRSGYLCLCVDDIDMPNNTGSTQYITALEALFMEYGVKGDWFVPYQKIMASSGDMTPTARAEFVQGVDSRGVFRVGHHSYAHCNLSLTGNVFAIGGAGDTVTVDRVADTITVTGAHTCTITGFRGKTISESRNALVAAGVTVGAMTAYIETLSRGEILASGTGAGPYNTQLLIDTTGATGYFKTEIIDAKIAMESLLGRAVDVIAPPFGAVSVDAQTALSAAGFRASRPGQFETRITTSYRLGSFGRYGLPYIGLSSSIKGADDAATRKNIRSLCEMIAQTGGVMALLAHETSEFTIAQWEILLQVVTQEYPEIALKNIESVMDDIEASGLWSTPDNITYTRTWPDLSDYHLQSDSPCIGTGAAITGIHDQATPATDADGSVVHFLPPNIGAYDGRKTLAITADYAPTGYNVRGATDDPAIIKPAVDNLAIDLSGLSADEPIQVKTGKAVKGFVPKGSNQTLKPVPGGGNSGFGF